LNLGEILQIKQEFNFQYSNEEYDKIPKSGKFIKKVQMATELADIKQECMSFESSNVVEVSNEHIIHEKYLEMEPKDLNTAVKRLLALVD
jgi:uncharacterized Zn finger protein